MELHVHTLRCSLIYFLDISTVHMLCEHMICNLTSELNFANMKSWNGIIYKL